MVYLCLLKSHIILRSNPKESYKLALKAIIAGLGNSSILDSKVMEEFARQIVPNYLQPFSAHNGVQSQALSEFRTDTIVKCEELIQYTDLLFQGEQTQLTEAELAALVTDSSSLSITALVLEQLQHLKATRPYLDDQLIAFLRYNDLLGTAIVFFLDEQLRQNERFRVTLTALQEKGLWQDVREIKDLLRQVMTSRDLSKQIKPRDEFTLHDSKSLDLIREAFAKLKQLPANNPQYSQLIIMGASVLSSTGALAEAEKSLVEARDIAQNDADRALATFNLFQVRLRRGDLEQALTDLQTAIQIDPHRYALHDVEKYPIERILGAGGMGVVFLCRYKLRKQWRVVKCFWESRKGPAEVGFEEAFNMSDIAGYVPTSLDYGYVDPVKQDRAFFVMEYIEGAIDGETWLEQHGKLNFADGLQVGLQIAKGLQAAHTTGILHLDLKPANILLKQTSTGIEVKIIDFGLAQVATSLRQEAVKQQHTRSHLSVLGQAVFGTLDYACPEQQGFEEYGKPGVQCDIFAFGKTLYRLLTNKHPRYNLRERDLPPNVPLLYQLLEDCVEEEPQSRPQSAQHLINRLKSIEETLKKEEEEKELQAEIARRKRLAEEQAEEQARKIRKEAKAEKKQPKFKTSRSTYATSSRRKRFLEKPPKGIFGEEDFRTIRKQRKPEKLVKQQAKTTHQQLSALNPLDWLRLLWWVLVMPQQLKAYREKFGEEDEQRVGKWLVSTLTWFPLLTPSLALGFELLPHSKEAWLPGTYLWISADLVGCWLLVGWFGDLDKEDKVFEKVDIVAFVVAFVVAGGLVTSVRYVVGEMFLVLSGVKLVVAFVVAFVVALVGVFSMVRSAVREQQGVGNLVSVMPFVAVGGFTAIMTVGWLNNLEIHNMMAVVAAGLVAGLMGPMMVGPMIFAAKVVKESLENGTPSWLARLFFPLLITAYLFLIYYCFLGGWRLFV